MIRDQLIFLSGILHIWIIKNDLERSCYLLWLHTWQQWQVHCFVFQSFPAWNFWFQACVIWWKTIFDPNEMVLLSVHVLATLYAWANEATNRKFINHIDNSAIISFTVINWIIAQGLSSLIGCSNQSCTYSISFDWLVTQLLKSGCSYGFQTSLIQQYRNGSRACVFLPNQGKDFLWIFKCATYHNWLLGNIFWNSN